MELKAHAQIDDYRAFTAALTDDEDWRSKGFRLACARLEQIRNWYEDKRKSMTPLAGRPDFKRAGARLNSEMAKLNLQPQLETNRGLVRDRLGQGTFGTVWKIEVSSGNMLAYKAYNTLELSFEEKLGRFSNGYSAMQRLSHPQIVKVYEFTKCPIGFYMEYIEGPNLREFSGEDQSMIEKLENLSEIARTLKYAHDQGVIHRDVKPENILMRYSPQSAKWSPILTDFDLAWFSTSSHVTKLGMGAFGYAAPEQFSQPGSDLAHRGTTDIYAFAQLSFFVLTGGRDPNPNSIEANLATLKRSLEDWTSPEAAETFLQLYRKCSEVRPMDRHQSFEEVCELLDDVYQRQVASQVSEVVPPESFLVQVRTGLLGLEAGGSDSMRFFSRTRSTQIELNVLERDIVDNTIALRVSLVRQDHLSFNGISYDEAQRALLKRISTYLEGKSVKRIGGRPPRGRFETAIEFDNIPRTRFGAKEVATITQRLIEIIES